MKYFISALLLFVVSCEQKPDSSTTTIKSGPTIIMQNFSSEKPTVRWQKQLQDGDDLFTEEGIQASNKLLDKYLESLNSASNKEEIWKAIEEVVKGFDKLQLEHDYLIETMEREDLAQFIQDAAKAAGLTYDGDVTEEWRMEW